MRGRQGERECENFILSLPRQSRVQYRAEGCPKLLTERESHAALQLQCLNQLSLELSPGSVSPFASFLRVTWPSKRFYGFAKGFWTKHVVELDDEGQESQ